MVFARLTILCFFILTALAANAQLATSTALVKNSKTKFSDTIIIHNGVCKYLFIDVINFEDQEDSSFTSNLSATVRQVLHKPKLLSIHGNISYDFFYRSKVDTPINLENFQQHTERVYLDILVKEKYPLKVNLTARQSNSPYFRNFFDVNLAFDKLSYYRNLKNELFEKVNASVNKYQLPNLNAAIVSLKKQQDLLVTSRNWLENPATLQKIVEERERIFYGSQNNNSVSIDSNSGKPYDIAAENSIMDRKKLLDNTNQSFLQMVTKNSKKKTTDSNSNTSTDSSNSKIINELNSFIKTFERKKNFIDSLEKSIKQQKKIVDSLQLVVQKHNTTFKQKLAKVNSDKALKSLANENEVLLNDKSTLEKKLAAIKTLSIGRSVLNYTELTAQNITISGVNVEYNPSYYAAFTAGKIDYRFRDFFNRSERFGNQYLIMGRFGFGNKDKRAIIFSYFNGRKSSSGLLNSSNATVNLMGYSIEAIFKKDEFTFLTAEFAKSTKPIIGTLGVANQVKPLAQFADRTNMGLNIKVQTKLAQTNTKFSGFYRRTGTQFQSFSLFSYNADQTAWLARVDQPFYKEKITFTAMLRRNDFTNPFANRTYKTSTVFKSVALNMHINKLPFISLGYFPGTQLYMIDRDRVRESAYYVLNGSASYSYSLKNFLANSTLVYNKYTSEATDSGFVNYNGINVYATQSLRLPKMQLQFGYAYNQQAVLVYNTIEAAGDYSLRKWLLFGFGVKYNVVQNGKSYLGQNIQLKAEFSKWGGLQLQYENSYLPTLTQQLAPFTVGRLFFYKKF